MKKWYLSKTIWVNTIGAIVLVVEYVTTQSTVGAEVGAMVLAILNILLRFVTNQKIG